MDLKQALQLRGGSNVSNHIANVTSNSKSSGNSVQSDGGNNSSCSNNHSTSTNTGESNRRASPVATPLLASCSGAASAGLFGNLCSSTNISCGPPVSHITGRARPPGELDAHDARLLKLARLHDGPSSHPCNTETQVLFNLNGGFNSGANSSNANHHVLSSYLSSSSNHSSNHGSPTSNYAGLANTSSLFNGGSPHSKIYPYAALQEEPIRNHPSPFILSAVPAPHPSVLSSASRVQHPSMPCSNPEPATSLFTPEQLLEFTQQTFIFKHFVAGAPPPPSLLLPIINSFANMSRLGAGPLLFGGNAGLYGVGGLRGNIDPEPGRCRRTDGKKWRCSREVVSDQKYCEKHMHRGRHRARANKLVNGSVENLSTMTNAPSNVAANASGVQNSSVMSTSVAPFASTTSKEAQLHFSLQPAALGSSQMIRSSSSVTESNPNPRSSATAAAAAGGLKRLLESNSVGGPLSRNLTPQSDHPPNLAELLKANSSSKSSGLTNLHLPARTRDTLDSPFPFACQPKDRDTDNSSLSQIVDSDPWPRSSRVADNTPNLSWFEQLPEEQNKRSSSFNTDLSIATLNSPLANLTAKFGSGQPDDLVSGVDASHFMGLSMDLAGAKVGSIGKPDEDRYNARNTWVPIAWDSPIGGPLGEVLQPNAVANSGGSFGGSLANNGGERCLNLIEEESWVHNEAAAHVRSPGKDSHSASLASPTGVLQMKASFASYSDSSSSASSPRSALKLDTCANLGLL